MGKSELKKLRIGLLGGSFNPVHKGHVTLAEKAIDKLKLDQVLFVPCYHAPHREGKKVISAKHRVAMLKRALKGKEKLQLSLIEVKRKGVSYTIDTLRALKKEFPKGTEFYFILGSDSWAQLPTWKSFKSLIKLCEFVVFNRKGYPVRAISDERQAIKLRIKPIEVTSTQIRDRVKKGTSIVKWVPKEVESYIQKERIYS